MNTDHWDYSEQAMGMQFKRKLFSRDCIDMVLKFGVVTGDLSLGSQRHLLLRIMRGMRERLESVDSN